MHEYGAFFSRLNILVENTGNRNMLQKPSCGAVNQEGLQRGQ